MLLLQINIHELIMRPETNNEDISQETVLLFKNTQALMMF